MTYLSTSKAAKSVILTNAVRDYFAACEGNKPSQTRKQFEIACRAVQVARLRMRDALDDLTLAD